jgi:hypothetical protein
MIMKIEENADSTPDELDEAESRVRLLRAIAAATEVYKEVYAALKMQFRLVEIVYKQITAAWKSEQQNIEKYRRMMGKNRRRFIIGLAAFDEECRLFEESYRGIHLVLGPSSLKLIAAFREYESGAFEKLPHHWLMILEGLGPALHVSTLLRFILTNSYYMRLDIENMCAILQQTPDWRGMK